jgi:hypothetical protein
LDAAQAEYQSLPNLADMAALARPHTGLDALVAAI